MVLFWSICLPTSCYFSVFAFLITSNFFKCSFLAPNIFCISSSVSCFLQSRSLLCISYIFFWSKVSSKFSSLKTADIYYLLFSVDQVPGIARRVALAQGFSWGCSEAVSLGCHHLEAQWGWKVCFPSHIHGCWQTSAHIFQMISFSSLGIHTAQMHIFPTFRIVSS